MNSQLVEVKKHKCTRCLIIFDRIDVFKKHLARKIKCEIIYKCEECDVVFTNKQNLTRHKNSYKHEKSISTLNTINNTANISAGDNSIIGNNNTQVNIIVRNFYSNTKVNIEEDHFKDVYASIMTPRLLITKTLRKIHFSENNPDNYNVYINNIRTKTVIVFENDGWTEIDNKFIYEIILDIIRYLTEKCEEVAEKRLTRVCSLTEHIEAKIIRKEYSAKCVREVYTGAAEVLYELKEIIKDSILKSIGPYLKDIEKNGSIGKFLPIKIKDIGKETFGAPKITQIENTVQTEDL